MATKPSEGNGEKQIDKNVAELPQPLPKKRKLKSLVWNVFERKETPSGTVAVCSGCKKSFVGESSKGTSHLKSHLTRCPSKSNKDVHQQLLAVTKNACGSTVKVANFKFSQDKSRMDFARMIIKHNYPFTMAEHEFFEIFCNGLQPEFKLMSRNTTRADILLVHQREKEKISKIIDQLSSRITITTDLWTSEHQKLGYICLTAHYINDDWVLKKKIIAYRYIKCPHDAETLFKVLSDMILEWNVDRKLFAIVVDNATTNDAMSRSLKNWLCDKSLLLLNGDLFHLRCSAHILNLIVQDGLKEARELVYKVRESARYVHQTPNSKQKFENAINHVKLKGKKKPCKDCPTRWNSTFEMLEAALGMRDAFDRLEQIDRNYKYNPSKDEWEVARVVCDCLRKFFEATKHFSGTSFPTSNVFFPDVCNIQLSLMEWENSRHDFLRNMAVLMKAKFVKYWEECSLLLAIAVVLDPRFKLDLVEYYYFRIYGSEADKYVLRVRSCLFDLFTEYGGETSQSHSRLDCGNHRNVVGERPANDTLSGFDSWYATVRASNILVYQKSELDLYLDEPVFPRNDDFNILQWWKVNSVKLPTLARMARDVLAAPATTVASEAAFSVGGRVIDEYRASLLPDIVEALVTTDDWIESERKSHGNYGRESC